MAASYSQQIKNELCRLSGGKSGCKDCGRALLYGMLLFSRGTPGFFPLAAQLTFQTENRAAAHLFIRCAVDAFGAIVTLTEPSLRNRAARPIYSVAVEEESDVRRICSFYFPGGRGGKSLKAPFLRRACCRVAFLRGVFLACGTMVNPEKEYHFEFSMADDFLCADLAAFLADFGLEFRRILRQNSNVLYLKESEQIEDALARLGAVKASLELMNLKLEKELRNKVNRVTNCETANIGKTVNAAQEQIGRITRLMRSAEFKRLPAALRQTAELRLQNPELSLRELCELDGTLTRSGLNHRLQKLCELADKL